MEFISIQNFKYGLDTRRSVMTSTPGVLAKLENAHINAGAEIEKRRSFFKSADGFPDGTFGIEATEAGLITFSQASNPTPLPGGVTSQQLQSPSTYGPDDETDVMIGVTYSCNFNGKAFVLAEFNSGTYAFYDGVVVPSSYSGRVLYNSVAAPGVNMTIDQMADAVVAQVETIPEWDAENLGLGIVQITSPPGVYFTAVPDVVSENGEFSDITIVDQNDNGTAPVSATARFVVLPLVGTPGTFALSAFSDAAGTTSIDLTVSPVAWDTDEGTTAEAIVDAVNFKTALTGYTAIIGSDGETVIIVAPSEFGDIDFNLTVTTTGDNDTDDSTSPGGLTVTVDETYLVKLYRNEFMHTHDVFSPWVHALASEGDSPYEFLWEECEFDGTAVVEATGVLPKYGTRAGTNFHKVMEINTEINAYYRCKVTDEALNFNYSPVVHILLSNMKV